MKEMGQEHRVRVSGAKGHPPTGTLKVIAAAEAGWRASLASPIVGSTPERRPPGREKR
ncbi:acyclic terpene utilization AtuA family protein [Sphingomonas sp. MMS24-JH45]